MFKFSVQEGRLAAGLARVFDRRIAGPRSRCYTHKFLDGFRTLATSDHLTV